MQKLDISSEHSLNVDVGSDELLEGLFVEQQVARKLFVLKHSEMWH